MSNLVSDRVSDAGEMLHRAAPPESRQVDLLSLLEERVQGLVERHRGVQKGADELRSRLESVETEMGLLQARCEEADRLRQELRERVQSLIDQVRRLESASAEAQTRADGEIES